jgi:hypothetical protein
LTDESAERVRLENPKTFSLVGLSCGGFNTIVIIPETLKRRDEFCDVLKKLTLVFLIGTPLHSLSDVTDILNSERDFPTYQILSPKDHFANIPLFPKSSGIAIKDLTVIPVNVLQLTIDPHVSLYVNPNIYEYVSHLIVMNTKQLIDKLPIKPSYDQKVFEVVI